MGLRHARDFIGLERRQLVEAMRAGHAIPAAELAEFEYRGVSLGLPQVVERLTWKKFKKVFHRDPRGFLRGWNVRLEQNGLHEPCVPKRRGGEIATFGHFRVEPAAKYRPPESLDPGALVLDYGLGGNRRREGLTWVRDPVVAVNAGSALLLLGWTYLESPLGPVGTPSFFTLERDCPLTHIAQAPRPACGG